MINSSYGVRIEHEDMPRSHTLDKEYIYSHHTFGARRHSSTASQTFITDERLTTYYQDTSFCRGLLMAARQLLIGL